MRCWILVLVAMLVACGGSSGGSTTVDPPVPDAASVTVDATTKTINFNWLQIPNATYYRLLENADGNSGFSQVGDDIPAGSPAASLRISAHMFDWLDAQYIVEACNVTGCNSSDVVTVTDLMLDTIGHIKASNSGGSDRFGEFVGLSADGRTLAVGAGGESSLATGIDGDQSDPAEFGWGAGAVYVFRDGNSGWQQEAYIKASNTEFRDFFGWSGALSADGNTLAVGAYGEDSNATGIDGDQADNSAEYAGAVYVFRFDGANWYQQAYLKASNTNAEDQFGFQIALSEDGDTIAVAAHGEDSAATGVDGDQADNSAPGSGAVYVFRFDGSAWHQQAYIKASNSEAEDSFGKIALGADGNTLAVGSSDSSAATGIGGDQADNSADKSGAVYLFRFNGSEWQQQAYIKASNTETDDGFGDSVALSSDGNTLAVGAWKEDSGATGINGNEADNSADGAGAIYIFRFDGTAWNQQAYVKASNTDPGDNFARVALAADGNTLAATALWETGSATGVNGDPFDNSAPLAGAVYMFSFDGTAWNQISYVKATNTEERDHFGAAALSGDGSTLAVGAYQEDSNATGINGDQSDNSARESGAVYVY